MDEIRQAFNKVKYDINFLKEDLINLKLEIIKIQNSLSDLSKFLKNFQITNNYTNFINPAHNNKNPTLQHINPTHEFIPTDNPTHNLHFNGFKSINLDISTGNEGVPTDRQTDQQTDRQTHNLSNNLLKIPQSPTEALQKPSLILEQLDNLKKDLRLKIKRLTPQEMVVLSTIYQFETQNKDTDYTLISQTLSLSESSIRDYVQKIIKKGIPINKEKMNNKRINLTIAKDLKQLASLNTLIALREL